MLDYPTYINSEEWKTKARFAKTHEVIIPAGECALCGRTSSLEAHHRTYVRLGHEGRHDVIVLCHRCHARHHGTYEEAIERQLLLPIVPRGVELN